MASPAYETAPSFIASTRVQFRVLYALNKLQIRDKVGKGGWKLVLGVTEPILAIVVAVTWHTLLHWQPPYGGSRVLFITTGLYSTFLFVHLSSEFRSVSKGSVALRRFPVETTLDYVVAAGLMKTFIYVIAGVIGFGGIYLFDSPEALPVFWTTACLGFASLVLLGLGMGLFNATVDQLFPIWRYVWIPLSRGLILFSGVIYVPDFLRTDIREKLAWNPVLHGLELFRMGFYMHYPKECYSAMYLWGTAFVIVLFALCADRVFRRTLDDVP